MKQRRGQIAKFLNIVNVLSNLLGKIVSMEIQVKAKVCPQTLVHISTKLIAPY